MRTKDMRKPDDTMRCPYCGKDRPRATFKSNTTHLNKKGVLLGAVGAPYFCHPCSQS